MNISLDVLDERLRGAIATIDKISAKLDRVEISLHDNFVRRSEFEEALKEKVSFDRYRWTEAISIGLAGVTLATVLGAVILSVMVH